MSRRRPFNYALATVASVLSAGAFVGGGIFCHSHQGLSTLTELLIGIALILLGLAIAFSFGWEHQKQNTPRS